MERKQDALRGVESPLFLWLTTRAPHRLRLPPPLTAQSFPELLSLLTAQVLPTLQQRWFTVWHPSALIHEDPRAPRPRGLIAMEPFDPVAIRIRKPAFPSHPTQATSTNLLLAFCSPKRPNQKRSRDQSGAGKPLITKLLKGLH